MEEFFDRVAAETPVDGVTDITVKGRPTAADTSLMFFEVCRRMHQEGLWVKMTSPFRPGRLWHVGFTPHGITGWNGCPDFEGSGASPLEAALQAEGKYLGAPEEAP